MDCFVVSIANGGSITKINWGGFLYMALMFGLFQALMPLFGFWAGDQFIEQIESFDHWLALIILTLIGGKMIYEDLKPSDGTEEKPQGYGFVKVLMLSIATSIDAMATGLVFLSSPDVIVKGVVIIGIGSFVLSLAGSLLGFYVGKKINFKFNLLGGAMLIGIGIKILLEHIL